ncbi:MAG: MBL fold metallo-hydrolase [Dehalococcoidia bacterium]|nr:MBL fold metallo-hydrolase [Dehalococcoidia bacterium]
MTVVANDDNVRIERIETAPFGTNAYIIVDKAADQSLFVDAPGEPARLKRCLGGTGVQAIAVTHGHMDHTMALAELRTMTGWPVVVHHEDARALPVKPDAFLEDGQVITLGQVRVKVLHTPGHTRGSICLLTGRYLIAGDTIFPDGPGKTASPSDFKAILDSLTSKIFVLPDDVEIYPGHGERALLKEEKAKFRAFQSKRHRSDLCGDVLWLSST